MTVVAVYTPDREGAAALGHAVHEAELRKAPLAVLGMPAAAGGSPEAEAALAQVRQLAEVAGVGLTVRDNDGQDLAEQAIDASYEDDVEAVVVGVRRRSPVGKMLLGGVAQRVVLEAHCPVVVVKLPAGPGTGP
jgi:nucleotide-binding universal stress UspA family protein